MSASDVFGIVGTLQAGNFQVERAVAEGGFGVVYRAQHGAFRAAVALKCLKVPSTMTEGQREAFLDKFREEAELLFRLSATIPEVVRPLQVGVLDLPGQFVPFLALEWLEGEPLDVILTRRSNAGKAPIALHKLMKMLEPIAQALARAHRLPGPDGPIAIIHRDLKPENIFLSEVSGVTRAKILDFGIARVKSTTSAIAGHLTAGDALNAFTPAYAAPEQWLPKRFGATGPWTDVWGFAITMVEALCGHAPIEGEVGAMMATALDEARRPTPRTEGVVVSPEVELAFERALAVDPRRRTKSIDDFWTDLEKALGVKPTFVPRDLRRESEDQPLQTLVGLSDAPGPDSDVGSEASLSSPPGPMPEPEREVARRVDASAATQRFGDAPPPAVLPDLELAISPPTAPPPKATPPAKPMPVVGSSAYDFDDDGPLDIPLAVQQPRSAPRARPAPVSRPSELAPSLRPTGPPLRERLKLPITLVVLSIAITVADVMYGRMMGEALQVESIRPIWIAAPLALLGVLLACIRVFGDES